MFLLCLPFHPYDIIHVYVSQVYLSGQYHPEVDITTSIDFYFITTLARDILWSGRGAIQRWTKSFWDYRKHFATAEAKYDFPTKVMGPETTQQECYDTVAEELVQAVVNEGLDVRFEADNRKNFEM